MTAGADVLVVLPCLDEATALPGILNGLLADPGLQGALIVVADGGSTDGTVEIAETASRLDGRVVLMRNPRRLQSAGVNEAAWRFALDRKWLVRMDAHADYPAGFVSGLVGAAKKTGADSVVVPMLTSGGGCFQTAVAAAQNSLIGTGGAAHRRLSGGGWVEHGHHALFRAKAFADAGGYDETFAANEDAELDVRLAQAGARIWLADDLAIAYHPRATPSALFRQYLKHGAGRARTILRHRLKPKLRQLAPSAVVPALLLLPAAIWLPVLAVPALVWASGSLFYGVWLGARQGSPCAMMAGAAAMIMHLAWSLGFWSRLLRGPGQPFAGPDQ